MKRDDSSKKRILLVVFIGGCVFEFIKIFTNFFKANKTCVVFDSTRNYITVVSSYYNACYSLFQILTPHFVVKYQSLCAK